MAAAVGNIDRMLIEPLSIGVDAPIVLVPSRPVAAVPWAALPSLSTRSFSVAPSAQLRADLARLPDGRGAVAVGVDDPVTARREARAVAGLIGGRSLLGPAATVESVLRAIDGVDVAHLACHGRFRFDNPLMSSVEMSDGPLTVYDMERLSDAPRTVVMSACEVGQTARTSGEGLLGMAASLMAAGTRNVIASGTTVSDEATETFMVEFHRARLDGLSAASALRAARAASAHEPDVALVGASFVCLGF
jgi:CHAT domain-containing protein